MHRFHQKFTEGYKILKYGSKLILVVIRKILAELWSFFDLDLVVLLILFSAQ